MPNLIKKSWTDSNLHSLYYKNLKFFIIILFSSVNAAGASQITHVSPLIINFFLETYIFTHEINIFENWFEHKLAFLFLL